MKLKNILSLALISSSIFGMQKLNKRFQKIIKEKQYNNSLIKSELLQSKLNNSQANEFKSLITSEEQKYNNSQELQSNYEIKSNISQNDPLLAIIKREVKEEMQAEMREEADFILSQIKQKAKTEVKEEMKTEMREEADLILKKMKKELKEEIPSNIEKMKKKKNYTGKKKVVVL